MAQVTIPKTELAAALGYKGLIFASASKYELDPAIVAAVGSRESGWGTGSDMKPKGPGGTGDWAARSPKPPLRGTMPTDGLGFGRGLMQADWDWSDFARTGNWADASANIDFGSKELATDIKGFLKRGLSDSDALRAGVAAYNHGFGGVWADIQSGGMAAVDAGTAGHNYSADVLARADFYRAKGFHLPAVSNAPTYVIEGATPALIVGQAVAPNFYTDVIANDPRFASVDRVADVGLLEPKTRALVQAIIDDALQLGYMLMIFETYRSTARQQALFDQGATKLRTVGVHHYGLACDLVKNVNGQPSWKGDFSFLGSLARHHGLVWGGDWGEPSVKPSFADDDHVQRIAVGRQASLFAGAWYPNASYDPYQDGAK